MERYRYMRKSRLMVEPQRFRIWRGDLFYFHLKKVAKHFISVFALNIKLFRKIEWLKNSYLTTR